MIDWAIVGQQVVCIDTKWISKFSDENYPYLGQILTIREVSTDRMMNNEVCFLFEEISNTPRNYWGYINVERMFFYHHFRPVKKTSIENFKSILLSKSNERKLEDA